MARVIIFGVTVRERLRVRDKVVRVGFRVGLESGLGSRKGKD
jgi:hypothetical protein